MTELELTKSKFFSSIKKALISGLRLGIFIGTFMLVYLIWNQQSSYVRFWSMKFTGITGGVIAFISSMLFFSFAALLFSFFRFMLNVTYLKIKRLIKNIYENK